ncbi:MAG: carbamoyltransferase HypF, partial [Candidatus Goldbacteria bacterium]|nr:carbamoyltransferase HypF [Candidatus Goldiibacteriota bacterium]
ENERVFKYYKQTIDDFMRFYEFKPQVIACDLHPNFLSSIYAVELASRYKIKNIKVQHHYAHLISAMAENRLFDQKAIGVIFDGTGLGLDNTIWGGEFLIGDLKGFERLGHFKYFKLPGGDIATRQTVRPAVSLLLNFMEKKDIKKIFKYRKIDFIIEMIEKNINSPLTSSSGRIFDAVSAILGICYQSTYEAQAPMMLESLAEEFKGTGMVYKYEIQKNEKNIYEVNIVPVIKEIINDLKKHEKKYIAFSFHKTIAFIILDMVKLLYEKTKIKNVVLSGGVFQNAVLLTLALNLLKKNKFNVLLHKNLSPNDSCIAFGQAVYAALNI